jgi:adenylate cyclase
VLGLRLAGSLERMELVAWDAGLRLRPAAAPDARLLFIDETEDDLQRFGHPLPDEVLARAIERALALGARVVGMDKFRDIPVPPGREALERVLAANPQVVWGYQFGGTGVRRVLPPRVLAGTARTGFVDITVDGGGVARRGLLYLDEGGPPAPSFALVLAAAWLAPQGIVPRADTSGPAALRLGAATLLPLEGWDGGYAGADAAGYQFMLDFRGAPARFARVSLGELLDGRADPALVQGRIAIVGSSAHSLRDFFETPFTSGTGQPVTGAELQAHQVSQLLRLALGESTPVGTLPKALEVLLLALCCAAGLAPWLASRALWLAAFVAAGAAVLAAAWAAAAAQDLWLPVVPLALGFLVTAGVAAAQRALREARERAELMAIFSRHVAPEVAQELWQRRGESGDGTWLRSRRLDITVLFADLHGYSPVAETHSPEDTAAWLNEFIRPMAGIIMQHRGVIRQYAGDAVMAVFGAPLPSATPAERSRDARAALSCARQMCLRHEALNRAWRAAGHPTAGLRIGIQSGAVVGCVIGSHERLEYTVIGDAVNVAARLQGLELPSGDEGEAGRILLGAETRALLPEDAPCEPIGSFAVKGRAAPVEVHRARTD